MQQGWIQSQILRLRSLYPLHYSTVLIQLLLLFVLKEMKNNLTTILTFITSGLQLMNGWHMPGILVSILHICSFDTPNNSMLLSHLFGERTEARDLQGISLSMVTQLHGHEGVFPHLGTTSSISFFWPNFFIPQAPIQDTILQSKTSAEFGGDWRNPWNSFSADQPFYILQELKWGKAEGSGEWIWTERENKIISNTWKGS